MTSKKMLDFMKKAKQMPAEKCLDNVDRAYVSSQEIEGSTFASEKEVNISTETFKRIMQKYPNGVTPIIFCDDYRKESGSEINFSLWGVETPMELFHALPSIFCVTPLSKNEYKEYILRDPSFGVHEMVQKLNNIDIGIYENINSKSTLDANVEIEMYKLVNYFDKVTISNFAELYRRVVGREVTPQFFGFETFAQFFTQLSRQFAINFESDTITLNELKFKQWISDCIRRKRFDIVKYFVNFSSDVALPGDTFKVIEISKDLIASESQNNDSKWMQVQITAADKFSKIFVQLHCNEKSFTYFSDRLQRFYSLANSNNSIPKEFIVKGFVCAVRPEDDYYWYRAQITKVHSVDQVTVNLVDFGYSQIVTTKLLRFIPRDFIDFEIQAIRVSLHGIQSLGKSTNADAVLEYSNPDTSLQCLFYPKFKNRHSVMLRYTENNQCVCINDVLIEKQLAKPTIIFTKNSQTL
ncbi:hypothetical protein B4U80_13048 [Leptotrombidium deliense]|uniref:Tudor domain-containing protein n=1 Tax=Leptotrombidium deliense TaxID=299467 RepID=A0A443SE14_9ACAR|nr:hypothetical protein B4U80_13048 [Leptotrombidium deliense]